jgi:hypothetical protein
VVFVMVCTDRIRVGKSYARSDPPRMVCVYFLIEPIIHLIRLQPELETQARRQPSSSTTLHLQLIAARVCYGTPSSSMDMEVGGDDDWQSFIDDIMRPGDACERTPASKGVQEQKPSRFSHPIASIIKCVLEQSSWDVDCPIQETDVAHFESTHDLYRVLMLLLEPCYDMDRESCRRLAYCTFCSMFVVGMHLTVTGVPTNGDMFDVAKLCTPPWHPVLHSCLQNERDIPTCIDEFMDVLCANENTTRWFEEHQRSYQANDNSYHTALRSLPEYMYADVLGDESISDTYNKLIPISPADGGWTRSALSLMVNSTRDLSILPYANAFRPCQSISFVNDTIRAANELREFNLHTNGGAGLFSGEVESVVLRMMFIWIMPQFGLLGTAYQNYIGSSAPSAVTLGLCTDRGDWTRFQSKICDMVQLSIRMSVAQYSSHYLDDILGAMRARTCVFIDDIPPDVFSDQIVAQHLLQTGFVPPPVPRVADREGRQCHVAGVCLGQRITDANMSRLARKATDGTWTLSGSPKKPDSRICTQEDDRRIWNCDAKEEHHGFFTTEQRLLEQNRSVLNIALVSKQWYSQASKYLFRLNVSFAQRKSADKREAATSSENSNSVPTLLKPRVVELTFEASRTCPLRDDDNRIVFVREQIPACYFTKRFDTLHICATSGGRKFNIEFSQKYMSGPSVFGSSMITVSPNGLAVLQAGPNGAVSAGASRADGEQNNLLAVIRRPQSVVFSPATLHVRLSTTSFQAAHEFERDSDRKCRPAAFSIVVSMRSHSDTDHPLTLKTRPMFVASEKTDVHSTSARQETRRARTARDRKRPKTATLYV